MSINGNGHRPDASVGAAPADTDSSVADMLAWSQNPEALGGSVDPLEEERARLEAELAGAKARVLAAQHRAAQLDADAKALLREELAASRAELAEIEARHRDDLAELREGTDREVERILAEARLDAERIEAESMNSGEAHS